MNEQLLPEQAAIAFWRCDKPMHQPFFTLALTRTRCITYRRRTDLSTPARLPERTTSFTPAGLSIKSPEGVAAARFLKIIRRSSPVNADDRLTKITRGSPVSDRPDAAGV
jgi:hypothetical protein